ncbi:bifunctional diguanylate cyclase/phosphodiesterase [Shewanella corallii]|uniref:Bifunctional diguanylate cyclase/phosphodiesterase n=1 Tax=Shewanella corallii TaxID=560080 RepID=A0ABT0N4L1_9GAMM|nr:bifunctional diguanylate cyclase/phosphodiesterase [Shewanella corallii]MCL2912811.1 bifunctional diguanylate cyclase/phosphodiesterase [Shewanella corallii]
MDWSSAAGLAIVLLALMVLVLLVIQYRQQQFLRRLVASIRRRKLPAEPLNIHGIPVSFKPLCDNLEELLDSLPADLGTDKLTGLLNRLGFKSAVGRMSPITSGTFVILDIHRFRYVNDLFGFNFGDKLLIMLTERLQTLHRQPELLARVKGDEFLLYYDEEVDREKLNQLRGRLQVPFDINGTPISIKLQFGCLTHEHIPDDVSLLLRRLDLSLKQSRESKDLIGFYGEGDDRHQVRELTLIHDLPRGLMQGQLFMMYQPKQGVNESGFRQVEALIRWQHPRLGMVSPGEFIPLAEYAGMIELVSRWALMTVLEQQQQWRSQGLALQVAVNLSTQDLSSNSLSQEIETRLKQYDLPADALMVEITESTLMANVDKSLATLNRLRELGVKLAIDDFGTGHSSLAYLKHLPVDEVKIDKAFLDELLTDPHAQHIMETSILLARKLGFEVTVEGVETHGICEMLTTMGADKLQGELIGLPMTAEDLVLFHRQKQQQSGACS